MAHPIRPESYIKMYNYYTLTVYEKGDTPPPPPAGILHTCSQPLGRPENQTPFVHLAMSTHAHPPTSCPVPGPTPACRRSPAPWQQSLFCIFTPFILLSLAVSSCPSHPPTQRARAAAGAEVVRMYEQVLGREGFRKGMDLYFKRHDGTAVTCDDFLAAMADANGADLEPLGR